MVSAARVEFEDLLMPLTTYLVAVDPGDRLAGAPPSWPGTGQAVDDPCSRVRRLARDGGGGVSRGPAVAVVSRWVNRLIVGLVGASMSVLSVMLLGLTGGPVVSESVGLFDVFGYVGLVLSTVLLLRVVVAAIKEETGGDRS